MKKLLSLILLIMIILAGCAGKPISASNNSGGNTTNNSSDVKSIPYKYAFTGFVFVDDVYNSLPSGTKIFKTQQEWTDFANKSFPYTDVPLPVYSGGIDFNKDALIYYSIADAKADFYAKAWQIDKITVTDNKLNVATKELDGNLTITANNSERKGGHRYVILVTVDKQYLQNLK